MSAPAPISPVSGGRAPISKDAVMRNCDVPLFEA